MVHMVIEIFAGRHAHHPFGRLHCQRRIGRDLGGQRLSGRHALVGRHHMRNQSELEALRGTEGAAGKDQLGGFRPADQTRQDPGAARFGHDTAHGEGRRHLRFARHDADIAAEREVHAVAGARAVVRADGRLVDVVQHDGRCFTQIEGRIHRALADAAATAQIEPSAKKAPRAGDQDDPHLIVGIGLHQAAADRGEHRPRDGVLAIGPIESDGGDMVCDRIQHLVGLGGEVSASSAHRVIS